MHRSLLVFLTVCLMCLPVPAAMASADAESRDVWTDGAGDVAVDPPLPAEDYPNADLLGLQVREVPSGFWFRVELAGFSSSYDDAAFSEMQFWIPFTVNGKDHTLHVWRGSGTILYYAATLRVDDEVVHRQDSWNDDTIVVDLDAAWIDTFVPRGAIGVGGPVPGPDDTLLVGQVRSLAGQTTNDPDTRVRATDLMPDEQSMVMVPIQHGAVNEGETWMSATTAFRQSNGGAGGFLYNLTVHNDNDEEQSYLLHAADTDGITVRLPSAPLSVPAAGDVSVPAYIEVPFGHQHGGHVATLVEARSTGTADVGRVHIGVEYLAIPQPAGHHDRLWFHDRQTKADTHGSTAGDLVGGSSRTRGYMNALADDPLDTDRSIPPLQAVGQADGRTAFRYVVELDPRLDIGLDFRNEDTGGLQVTFQSPMAMEGELDGRLVWVEPRPGGSDPAMFSEDEALVLGTVSSQQVSLDDAATVEAELALTEASDQVVYVEGSDLMLELLLHTAVPRADTGEFAPQILPGGFLDVPLNEYRDPVADVFRSTLHLDVDEARRQANPGDVLLAHLDLQGDDLPATEVTFSAQSDAVGTHFPTGARHAFGGAALEVPVVLTIPDDAPLRDAVPVYLLADSRQGTAGSILFVDIIDTPVPDDAAEVAALQADSVDTPALALAWALLALVAGVVVRRCGRRRN